MSLQTYTSDYWPGMCTTAPSVVHVNTDFFKAAKEKLLHYICYYCYIVKNAEAKEHSSTLEVSGLASMASTS